MTREEDVRGRGSALGLVGGVGEARMTDWYVRVVGEGEEGVMEDR